MVKFWERARFWYAVTGFKKTQVQNLQTFCGSSCFAYSSVKQYQITIYQISVFGREPTFSQSTI